MPKKIPMRQCLGCREMKPKKELIRIVRSSEGTLSLDSKGKLPGRGAYLCCDVQCLERALKSKAVERSLEVPVSDEIIRDLRSQMENIE
jgi:predicted RNA-binding protein YlxR (DUF448 family)